MLGLAWARLSYGPRDSCPRLGLFVLSWPALPWLGALPKTSGPGLIECRDGLSKGSAVSLRQCGFQGHPLRVTKFRAVTVGAGNGTTQGRICPMQRSPFG